MLIALIVSVLALIGLAKWQKKHLSWGYITAGKRALLGIKGIILSGLIALVEHFLPYQGRKVIWWLVLWPSVYLIALATFRRKDIMEGRGKEPDEDEEL